LKRRFFLSIAGLRAQLPELTGRNRAIGQATARKL
jgi:hypothetical protein